MLRKIIFLIAAMCILGLLQLLWAWRVALALGVGPVAPELVMLLVAFVALHETAALSACFAWGAGIIWDLLLGPGAGLGPGLVGCMAAAGSCMIARRLFFSSSLLLEPVLAMGAVGAGGLAIAAIAAATGQGGPIGASVLRAVYIAIYSAAAAPLVFSALRHGGLLVAAPGPRGAALREWSRARQMHQVPSGSVVSEQ